MAEKRSCWGATRNNLIFNDVRIFRVGGPVTLKMLNFFIYYRSSENMRKFVSYSV